MARSQDRTDEPGIGTTTATPEVATATPTPRISIRKKRSKKSNGITVGVMLPPVNNQWGMMLKLFGDNNTPITAIWDWCMASALKKFSLSIPKNSTLSWLTKPDGLCFFRALRQALLWASGLNTTDILINTSEGRIQLRDSIKPHLDRLQEGPIRYKIGPILNRGMREVINTTQTIIRLQWAIRWLSLSTETFYPPATIKDVASWGASDDIVPILAHRPDHTRPIAMFTIGKDSHAYNLESSSNYVTQLDGVFPLLPLIQILEQPNWIGYESDHFFLLPIIDYQTQIKDMILQILLGVRNDIQQAMLQNQLEGRDVATIIVELEAEPVVPATNIGNIPFIDMSKDKIEDATARDEKAETDETTVLDLRDTTDTPRGSGVQQRLSSTAEQAAGRSPDLTMTSEAEDTTGKQSPSDTQRVELGDITRALVLGQCQMTSGKRRRDSHSDEVSSGDSDRDAEQMDLTDLGHAGERAEPQNGRKEEALGQTKVKRRNTTSHEQHASSTVPTQPKRTTRRTGRNHKTTTTRNTVDAYRQQQRVEGERQTLDTGVGTEAESIMPLEEADIASTVTMSRQGETAEPTVTMLAWKALLSRPKPAEQQTDMTDETQQSEASRKRKERNERYKLEILPAGTIMGDGSTLTTAMFTFHAYALSNANRAKVRRQEVRQTDPNMNAAKTVFDLDLAPARDHDLRHEAATNLEATEPAVNPGHDNKHTNPD
eukprot:gene1827-biopygen884